MIIRIHFRKTVYLSIFLVILSCKPQTSEIRYYPSTANFSTEKAQFIGLDTINMNFRQITNKVASYYGKLEYLVVDFNDGQIKKHLKPFVYGGGLIKYRNVLEIKSDSILIDDGYPISELKRILKRHYLNKGKNFRYSDSPKKALVEITIDTNKNGKELKDVLINLTRTFDEIKNEVNDTIELKVYFDYLRQFPPPPPPKMEDEEKKI
tara:strand:+ start:6020 stop:6643 length:624 start_codon:yes stop_codon:yes gene_type:complete